VTREPKTTYLELMQTFQEHTCGHMEAIYSDALCLTGSRSEAVELTVQTCASAFQGYDQFRRRFHPWGVATHPGADSELSWLRGYLHAAFCGAILGQAKSRPRPKGD
jgi:hypothetical protein